MLRVQATRYVTPFKEGGSMPGLVEGSDQGMYVVKFIGAGQGRKVLIAELVAGELGRALGLRVPELALVEVDVALGRNEADPEIRELLMASAGLNLGLDYLPGSLGYDPLVPGAVNGLLASTVVWFDALVLNVDRTPRNPNLLVWHRDLWLIDHGAALYPHFDWKDAAARAGSAFPAIKDHVLLPRANRIAEVDATLRARLIPEVIARIVENIPDDWLTGEPGFDDPAGVRDAYRRFLSARLDAASAFVTEAARAHAQLV